MHFSRRFKIKMLLTKEQMKANILTVIKYQRQ